MADRVNWGAPHIQVNVDLQAEVLSPAVARRKANDWLMETVGNLLGAETQSWCSMAQQRVRSLYIERKRRRQPADLAALDTPANRS